MQFYWMKSEATPVKKLFHVIFIKLVSTLMNCLCHGAMDQCLFLSAVQRRFDPVLKPFFHLVFIVFAVLCGNVKLILIILNDPHGTS